MSVFNKNNQEYVEVSELEKSRVSTFFELISRKIWSLCKINFLYVATSIPALLLLIVIMGIFSQMATNALLPFIAEQIGVGISDLNNPELAISAFQIDIYTRLILTLWFFVFFGTGPSSAGVTYILRNYSREESVFLLSDWWEHTRSNFRQAIVVFVIDILAYCCFIMAGVFYLSQNRILFILIIYFLIVYLLVRMYLYQVMITFKCSIKNLFRNSFTIVAQNLPKSLLLLVVLLIFHVAIPCIGIWMNFDVIVWTVFVLLELILLPTLSSFMTNFFIYPYFDKYINQNTTIR